MANNISVIGRLAADSELKYTPSGAAVLEFRIADDVGFGDKKATNWWRCAMWGKQAEGKLGEFLTKGQQVVVFGEVTMREWTNKEGVKQLSPEIRVNAVQLAGSRQEGGHSAPAGDGGYEPAPSKPQGGGNPKPDYSDLDDSIPF